MKNKKFILASVIAFSFPLSAFAINPPKVDPIPDTVDADIYTITFQTELDAKITVLGGPADIPPVTDGVGNPVDGVVEVTVGLAQNQANVFSVIASKNGETSSSITLTINEADAVAAPDPSSSTGSAQPSAAPQGDTTPPMTPVLDDYPEDLEATEWDLTGSTESEANIYARHTDGSLAASTKANSQGVFSLKLPLEIGKTNRFNISAEDGAGNEGASVQVLIRVPEAVIAAPVQNPTEAKKESSPFPFIDAKNHWAETYIKMLYEMGVVSGKTETHFDPNAQISRAELTKIAVNTFFNEAPETPDNKPFSDVSTSAWFAPYVHMAKEEAVISGVSGKFRPNEFITRAAALKILFEASQLPLLEVSESYFNDVPENAWFAPYVLSAFNHNIVSGYFDKTFRPGAPITRAEVAKIVVKIMELVAK